MHIWSNDSLDPSRAEELFIDLIDSAPLRAVYRLRVAEQEDVFFECDPDDALSIVEAAFVARNKMREDGL